MGLADRVEKVFTGRPGAFGVYARNLGTGETVAIHADRVLPAESAAKTFVLVYFSRLRLERTTGLEPATLTLAR